MRATASASTGATLSTFDLFQFVFPAAGAMVSSSTTSSSALSRMRPMAGPEEHAVGGAGRRALGSASALMAPAAIHSVPAVSIISSTMTTSRPSTSPMMFITSETFALGRRLSTMASGTSKPFGKATGAGHAAQSGLTTVTLSW